MAMEAEAGEFSDTRYETTPISLSDHDSPTADEVVAVAVKLGVAVLEEAALTTAEYAPYSPDIYNIRTR